MNNTLIHDWNSYESNLDYCDDLICRQQIKESNKILENYNQMKNDYNLLKKYSNHWAIRTNPMVRKSIKELSKIFG